MAAGTGTRCCFTMLYRIHTPVTRIAWQFMCPPVIPSARGTSLRRSARLGIPPDRICISNILFRMEMAAMYTPIQSFYGSEECVIMFYDMAENWCVLALAIFHEKPLTVESAFRIYMGEKRHISSQRTLDEIERLRNSGFHWRDINRMLCLQSADSYYRHYRLEKRRRQPHEKEKLFDAEDAAAPAGTTSCD